MQSTGTRNAGLSLTIKLPVLIGALLVVTIVVYSTASYIAARRSTISITSTRLGDVTQQVATLLKQSSDQMIVNMKKAADTSVVTAFLTHPDARRQAALTALLQPNTPAGKQVASVQAFDAGYRSVLATGDTAVLRTAAAATEELIRGLGTRDTGVVGRFLTVKDSVIYPAGASSMAGGRVIGYIVVWRYLTATPQARQQLTQLIGAGAHLYVGNVGDNIWTDLTQPVPPPPVAVGGTAGLLRYVRPGPDGGPMLATARAVRSAPWTVLIEFPMATVLAPAAIFLRDSLLIGAVILALGLLVAWIASHRVTGPLVILTRTAEGLAGQHAPMMGGEATEGDEILRLAAAFESMVTHVQESQRDLENRVKTRTTELQERNEELESFAYSISHDLRAPLRAMDGFSQALLEEYGDKLDATGRQYAERVKGGARRMDLLIRDLLAYSKMTRSDIKVGPIELERVVKGALEQVEGDVRARGARVVVDEHLPPVLGHEATLTQVVMNLMANGIKFVPAGRTPEIRVRSETRDGVIRLWILDNGIGIPREYHERIFRVFERLHRVDEYPGTGIGLAIVRKGVERMGG
ncbi:MAG TPA: ATP-binding protein, partial [Gemmatimonadales bacterium]|nr:ATP-binding protein [Gemmatimonadales bacterium]